MSLREILVYVGTYVLQQKINKSIFVNIVRNKIKDLQKSNQNLEYVIITDNRFIHELNYIYENNGITISIKRDSVKQLENIAEHDLDDEDNYDFVIDNSGTYDDLFEKIWDIVHSNLEFQNKTVSLQTRDNVNNYLRLIDVNNEVHKYKLCVPLYIQKIYKNEDAIKVIDPIGGPTICINEYINVFDINNNEEELFVIDIQLNIEKNQFFIYAIRGN